MLSNLCTPHGQPLPREKYWGEFSPTPLGSGGMVQTFPDNSPWKGVFKTGFKSMGTPPKNLQNVNAIAMNWSQLLHTTVLSWTSMCDLQKNGNKT